AVLPVESYPTAERVHGRFVDAGPLRLRLFSERAVHLGGDVSDGVLHASILRFECMHGNGARRRRPIGRRECSVNCDSQATESSRSRRLVTISSTKGAGSRLMKLAPRSR